METYTKEFIDKILSSEKERIKYAMQISTTHREAAERCGLYDRKYYRRLKKYNLSKQK